MVPESFEGLEGAIQGVYQGLVEAGTITPTQEVAAPAMPLDLEAAKKAGKVRSQPRLSGQTVSIMAQARMTAAPVMHLELLLLVVCWV